MEWSPRSFVRALASEWGRKVTGGVTVGALAFAAISENSLAVVFAWPGWPGFALGLITLAWFVLSLPVAQYQVWRRDQAALQTAHEKLASAAEAHAPIFSTHIREIQWSTDRQGETFWAVMTVLIRNVGADCGILGFGATVDLLDHAGGVRAMPFDLRDGDTLTLNLSSGSTLTIEREHLILHRVDNVPRNQHVVGILPVRFDYIDGPAGPDIVDFLALHVEFSDVRGTLWGSEPVTDRDITGPVVRSAYSTLPTECAPA
jgi:hypothetical protein